MTLSPRETWTRRLAIKISRGVVRFASPGCKEWAEGLAREVDFIESDWRALMWAIGSMRVLLDYREAPIATLDEVPEAAAKFLAKERKRTYLMSLVTILGASQYVWNFFAENTGTADTGCALLVFAAIGAAILLLMEWYRPNGPVVDENSAWALFYKQELERRCTTLLIWTAILFFYLFGIMFSRQNVDYAFNGGLNAISLAIVVPLMVHLLRANRRRVERIEELMRGRG